MTAWREHQEAAHRAEVAGDLEAARRHHEEAARQLADGDDAATAPLGVELLQLARMEVMTGGNKAATLFRSALACAALAREPHLRSVVWHYVAAWCERRELWPAALLGYQEAADALPAGAEDERLVELRHQLVPLDRMGEWHAFVATLRLIENAGGDDVTLPTTAAVLDQLGLSEDDRAAVIRFLGSVDGPEMLRANLLARACAAVPEFAYRFETGVLKPEDTAVILPDTAPGTAFDQSSRANDLDTLWDLSAAGALRDVRAALDVPNATLELARGWERMGAYLTDRARPEAALLAHAAALRLADAKPTDATCQLVADQALRGAAHALADLGEPHARWACIAMLERRGALGHLPIIAQVLAGQDLHPWVSRLLRARLLDDAWCRTELDAAVCRAQRSLPDFERRVRLGAERSDTLERLLEVVREPARAGRLVDASNARVRGVYRRRLVVRAVTAVAATVATATGLLLCGASGWAWPLQLAAIGAVATVAAVGAQRVRHMLRWVRAHSVMGVGLPFLHALERGTSTHAEAHAVLERCLRDRSPFALYLRSFENEGSEHPGEKQESAVRERVRHIDTALMEGLSPSFAAAGLIAERRVVMAHFRGPSEVDAYLGSQLAAELPVVGVFNPVTFAGDKDGSTTIPRLELDHERWTPVVQMLISAARLIVVECSVLSPGVVKELEMIVNSECADRTIIVLPSADTIRSLEVYRDIDRAFRITVPGRAPFATPDAAALSPFSRVVTTDVLLAAKPVALPVFDGLLPVSSARRDD